MHLASKAVGLCLEDGWSQRTSGWSRPQLVGALGILVCWLSPAQSLLQVDVTKGKDEVHRVRERTISSTISATVLDERERPVPGATVRFTLPSQGAGGAFANDQTLAIVHTDADGVASITGFQANGLAGRYTIYVAASFEGKAASVAIDRTNEERPFATKRNIALMGAGAAAVLVSVFTLRSPPPPTATISSVTSTGPVGSP